MIHVDLNWAYSTHSIPVKITYNLPATKRMECWDYNSICSSSAFLESKNSNKSHCYTVMESGDTSCKAE